MPRTPRATSTGKTPSPAMRPRGAIGGILIAIGCAYRAEIPQCTRARSFRFPLIFRTESGVRMCVLVRRARASPDLFRRVTYMTQLLYRHRGGAVQLPVFASDQFEPLESRTHLTVSIGADGWTNF